MKTIALIFIAVFIFLALIIFIAVIYSINVELESQTDYVGGDGSLDSDLELDPSYAYDSVGFLSFNSIFVAGPIMLGVISLAFIIPNIILRIKKIPTRKYMLVLAAGVLIFFSFGYVQNGIGSLLTVDNLKDESNQIILIGGLIPISLGLVFIIPAIILLKRAKLRIRK